MIFLIAYIVWFLSEIILNRVMRSNHVDAKGADKNSLLIIWVTVIISISVAVFISLKYYLPVYDSIKVSYTGLVLIFGGIILRLIIIMSLGKFFTVDVTIRQDHELKTNGFYKYLRHPSYFASFITFVGFGLTLNNWISLLLIVISVFIVFRYRIKVEEKALATHFGEAYLQYKMSTRAMIPFIY